jgi:hypothetical protein
MWRFGRRGKTRSFPTQKKGRRVVYLAAVGGAFVHAALVSKGMLSIPPPDGAIYYLIVAFIAFVNAGLFASANNVAE